jgi:flagellar motor switch protein FliG
MPENLPKTNPFAFEDLVNLADWVIQRLLKDIDSQDLAIALKTSDTILNAQIYKNLSSRAAKMLQYEVDLVGPTQMREADKSKQRIVNVILTLEQDGQIVIPHIGGLRPPHSQPIGR